MARDMSPKEQAGTELQASGPVGLLDRFFGLSRAPMQHRHRASCRRHHLPHHGLHHVRQSDGAGACGHGSCAVFVATCLAAATSTRSWAFMPTARRAGARHGPECLFRLYRGARAWRQLEAGARLRFLSGVLFFLISLSPARMADRCYPDEPETRYCGRYRLFLALIGLPMRGSSPAMPPR